MNRCITIGGIKTASSGIYCSVVTRWLSDSSTAVHQLAGAQAAHDSANNGRKLSAWSDCFTGVTTLPVRVIFISAVGL